MAMLLLAQAADPSTGFLQYGAVGLFVIVLLGFVKVLFQKQVETFQRERDRADRLEQELRALNVDVREQVMPALTRSTEAVTEAMKQFQARR